MCYSAFAKLGGSTRGTKVQEQPVKRFQCDLCDYNTSNLSNFRRHKKQVHNKVLDDRFHNCEMPFATSVQEERPVKRWVCDRCDYQTSDQSNFLRHKKSKRVHDKVLDYRCDDCEQPYAIYSNSHLVRLYVILSAVP